MESFALSYMTLQEYLFSFWSHEDDKVEQSVVFVSVHPVPAQGRETISTLLGGNSLARLNAE